jgi:hypothetical protein
VSCSFTAPTKVASVQSVAQLAGKQLGIDTPSAAGDQVRVAGAGWQTVGWFIANADRLGIEQVDYAGRRWTRANGWRKNTSVTSAAVTATMHHK